MDAKRSKSLVQQFFLSGPYFVWVPVKTTYWVPFVWNIKIKLSIVIFETLSFLLSPNRAFELFLSSRLCSVFRHTIRKFLIRYSLIGEKIEWNYEDWLELIEHWLWDKSSLSVLRYISYIFHCTKATSAALIHTWYLSIYLFFY